MKVSGYFGLLLIVSMLSGCAAMGDMVVAARDSMRVMFGGDVPFVEPPADATLLGERHVELVPLGDNAVVLASVMKEDYFNLTVSGRPYFQISPSNPDGLRVEVDIDELFDAQRRIRESRIRCPGDDFVEVCDEDEGYRYSVSCIVTEVVAAGSMKVSRNATGERLVERSKRAQESDKFCEGDGGSPASLTSLRDAAVRSLAANLVSDLVPSVQSKPVDVVRALKDLSAQENAMLEAAYEKVEQGSLLQALGMYEQIRDGGVVHSGLAFNIAFVNHALGNYAVALNGYEQALALPEADVSLIRRYQQGAAVSNSQGIDVLMPELSSRQKVRQAEEVPAAAPGQLQQNVQRQDALGPGASEANPSRTLAVSSDTPPSVEPKGVPTDQSSSREPIAAAASSQQAAATQAGLIPVRKQPRQAAPVRGYLNLNSPWEEQGRMNSREGVWVFIVSDGVVGWVAAAALDP
ncbi:MAG: hypothetical protein ACX94A_04535 [Algiphilus sp.]